jgi:DNA-binding SARP family transcriptional activator
VQIRLTTLGRVRCELDDRDLAELPGQRLRCALLIYLAVERKVARETVQNLLWSDRIESGRGALKQTVFELRRTLGDGCIESRGDELHVHANVSTDLQDFVDAVESKNWQAALEYYGGEFLRGFSLPNCKSFEFWVDRQRAHAARLHRIARRGRTAESLAANDFNAALRVARRWVELEPLEDEAQHRLIELLAASGERAEALRQADDYERLLEADGLTPLEETKQLVQGIRTGHALTIVGFGNLPVDQTSQPPLTALVLPPYGLEVRPRRSRFFSSAALVGLVVLVVSVGSWIARANGRDSDSQEAEPAVDTTLHLLVPFDIDGSIPALQPEDRFRDALAAWNGIQVIDLEEVKGAQAAGPQFDTVAVKTARAGRVVRGRISPKADSLRVEAAIYDGLNPNVRIAHAYRVFAANTQHIDEQFRLLADSLLLSGLAPECLTEGAGIRSLPALHACDGAFLALARGETARADSLLSNALRYHRRYARAALWLSEIRGWLSREAQDTILHGIASANAVGLSARERVILRAQRLMMAQRYSEACTAYSEITASDSLDYVGWLGLGECRRRDDIVVKDPRSSSGWSFRSSYHRAIESYRRAFQIHPALLAGFRDRSFFALRDILITNSVHARQGRALAPDTTSFWAYPMWQGDTLALLATPAHPFATVLPASMPASFARASDRQKAIFRELAARWFRQSPNSSAAAEGWATALELAGERGAVAALERARALARTDVERAQLATNEVWLRIKNGLPSDHMSLRRARSLADSLMKPRNPEIEAIMGSRMAGLALLLGRPERAAELARRAASRRYGSALATSSAALMAFASAGSPIDSIAELERQTEVALKNSVSPDLVRRERQRVLTQAAMISFPNYVFRALPQLGAAAFVEAELAYLRNDTTRVLAVLARVDSSRTFVRPADITIDALFVEAWLLRAVGRRKAAIDRLDPALAAIRFYSPARLGDLAHAGPLLQAIKLRAQLAREEGDADDTMRWMAAARILLAN